MGGADRLLGPRSLSIEGDGEVALLGQDVGTPSVPAAWKVTGWRRTIDLNARRMRVWQQTRQPMFVWAFKPPPPFSRGIDGAVAYDVVPDGTTLRASASVATAARIEMLHHPLVLLRAALQPGARLANRRVEAGYDVIDLTTSEGDLVALGFDAAYGMLTMAWSPSYDHNLGDVVVETGFYRYEAHDGLMLPMRIVSRLDRFAQNDLNVTGISIDVDVRDLVAPDAVRAKTSPPDTPPVHVTVERLGAGVWRLAGQTHHSVVIEFADHVRIFEVPLSEARSLAVIATARRLGRGKPVTHAVISHRHFDHAAGLRAAIAEGLTIVTERENEGFVRELAARSHSRHPDMLARHPRPLRLESVNVHFRLQDRVNALHLMTVDVKAHSGTALVAYLERLNLAVHADFFDSESDSFSFVRPLYEVLRVSYGRIARHVPIHGRPLTHATFLRAVASTPP